MITYELLLNGKQMLMLKAALELAIREAKEENKVVLKLQEHLKHGARDRLVEKSEERVKGMNTILQKIEVSMKTRNQEWHPEEWVPAKSYDTSDVVDMLRQLTSTPNPKNITDDLLTKTEA